MKILGLNITRAGNGGTQKRSNVSSIISPTDALMQALGIKAGAISANLSTAQTISAVYQGVRLMSQDVAGLTLNFYKKSATGKDILNNEVSRLFMSEPDPIGRITTYKFFETHIKHIALRGNSFAIIHRNPLRLEFVHSNDVTLLQNDSTKEVFYRISKKVGSGPNGYFTSNDVLHFKNFGDSPYWGDSFIKWGAKSLGIGLAQQTMQEKFYENGSIIRDYLRTDNKLSDSAFDRLKAYWDKKYKGVQNSGNTPILEEGLKYETVSIKAEDVQLIEGNKLTVVEVARWINVPPDKLFDLSKVSYSSMEQSSANYAMQTIAPLCTNIEYELKAKLLNAAAGEYCKFNLDELIRADTVAKADAMVKLVNGGIFMRNEARSLYEQNNVDGAGELLFPLNAIPQSMVTAYYEARIKSMEKGVPPPGGEQQIKE